jgi:hypothetical protein
MPGFPQDFLLPQNRAFLDLRERFRRELTINPDVLLPPWLRPCKVRALIVADGLDFSTDDFGLSAFVTTLLDTTSPGRFEVTLAHIGDVSGPAMMDFEPRIAARIPNFAFDETAHFLPDRFDVVFLFGIATFAFRADANGDIRTASDGQPYPTDQLAPTELQRIGEFMNGGGGLFATGDHGALGRFLGRELPRARNMRLWDSTSPDPDIDEVSMGGPRRNDTNRLGDPGSQFDDQSDDVPQAVQPKMYVANSWLFSYSFPHPVLCGPKGVIRVMPDHPHEGECVEPPDPDLAIGFVGALGPEYPPAVDAGPRPLPEIISTNTVLANTTSGGKFATEAHPFGGIAAYDGHRAGVGRVITDATWHHFVNVNLIGENFNPDPVKSLGFLASAAGQAHFEDIKAYFRNLGVWLSRPGNIACMNWRLIVRLIHAERVMEAVLTTRHVKLEAVSVTTLMLIGRHARDVLGKFASRCQSRRLIIDLIWPEFEKILPEIDPWRPRFTPEELRERGLEPSRSEATWINLELALDAALGAALVAVNDGVRFGGERAEDEAVAKHAAEGARRGMELALDELGRATERLGRILRR